MSSKSSKSTVSISVTLGIDDRVATIHHSNRLDPVVANVLGIERDERGAPVRIFLRSLIHSRDGTRYAGWCPSGAVTTILQRIENSAP